MNKQLLAACVAAISLTAAGCTEDHPKSAPPRAQLAPVPAPEVHTPPVVTASAASAGVSTVLDAGVPEQEPPDLIGLGHEDGRLVDHLARSAMLREEGDLPGALAEARRAEFDDPRDLDALTAIDHLAKLTHDPALRVEVLGRLSQLQPEDATPLIQKARVLLSLRNSDAAIATANEAATRDESNPEVYQALGRAYLSRGELTPAISSFRKVLSLEPDHGYALNNLGLALLRSNQNAEAVEVLTRAAQLLPDVAYVHNNFGIALERMGRTEEAKHEYAQASFLSPKYVKAQINASRVAALSVPLEPSGEEAGPASPLPVQPLEADPTLPSSEE